jgi:hypothetical protein
VAQLLRQILGGRVARYLVMLYPLRRTDQSKVGIIFLFLTFFHYFMTLLEKAHHAFAKVSRVRSLREVHLSSRSIWATVFNKMLNKALAQAIVPGRFGHRRKSFGQLLLGV